MRYRNCGEISHCDDPYNLKPQKKKIIIIIKIKKMDVVELNKIGHPG